MTPKTGERIFDPAYSKELLDIADQDLNSARALKQVKMGRPENIVFLCQQAMEKSLKAVLCSQSTPVPLVHDLSLLNNPEELRANRADKFDIFDGVFLS